MNQRTYSTRRRSRAAFTLIEIMVALAILMLMLTIIFVPLNMGVNLLHIGQSRADLQQAAQATLNRIAGELRQAVFVYPNDNIPGITDKSPYNGRPYYRLLNVPSLDYAGGYLPGFSVGACSSTGTERVGNTARIDFLLPHTNASTGAVETPLKPGHYLVTYYARRLVMEKGTPPNTDEVLYDPYSNPLVLYRAQIPFRLNTTGTPPFYISPTSITKNAETLNVRYPNPITECGMAAAARNRGSYWLYQSRHDEPNLEPVAIENNQTDPAAHTLATPRDMGLIAPQARQIPGPLASPASSIQPNTSFICEDTNDDGRIDRVKITITLGQFDSAGASTTDQRVSLSQTVDLPNVR